MLFCDNNLHLTHLTNTITIDHKMFIGLITKHTNITELPDFYNCVNEYEYSFSGNSGCSSSSGGNSGGICDFKKLICSNTMIRYISIKNWKIGKYLWDRTPVWTNLIVDFCNTPLLESSFNNNNLIFFNNETFYLF